MDAPQAFVAAGDFLDLHTIVALHDHHFTARDQALIDQHFHRVIDVAVQFHDRPGGQLEDFLHGEARFTERDADRKVDIEEQADGPRVQSQLAGVARIFGARRLGLGWLTSGRRGDQRQ